MYRKRLGAMPTVTPWHLKPALGAHKRDFLSLHDITITEMEGLLKLAAEVKAHPKGVRHGVAGKDGGTDIREAIAADAGDV